MIALSFHVGLRTRLEHPLSSNQIDRANFPLLARSSFVFQIEGVETAQRFRLEQFLMFSPVGGAEHRKAGAIGARAFWRRARQDAEASDIRPGMACRRTPLRLRSGGYPLIALLFFAMRGRRLRGGASLVTFLSLLTRK